MTSPTLSVVSPVYGSPGSLEPLCQRVADVCAKMGISYEIILVDDHCPRGSWAAVKEICAANPFVKGMRFSRNFGQHSAIEAGLKHSTGEWVVVMDCDLQDQPEEIPNLFEAARKEDAKIVLARRAERNDSLYRRAISAGYYGLLSFMTGKPLDASVANFGLYHRTVVDAYCSWEEEQKYFPVMIQWMGFDPVYLDVAHSRRSEGKSSYTFRKLLKLASDVVFSFSDRPLWIIVTIGLIIAAITFVLSIVTFIQALMGQFSVSGYPSLILSVWFMGGVLICSVGLTGIYVGRTLREAKARPSYIVADYLNDVPGSDKPKPQ
ncbi:glycosyltransferase [Henriciella barbarensis]|uniref:Glycosyltransferase n=1 Tax=Henriciella barbarensis TaxID=86342 RepID=A0A399QYK4_9PROT|nr:glycosyltransferase family 2 protein [Henriciella barbarensis]RIJ23968.1 glycosyltransferase [Henriciella barbarensis]